MHKTRWLMVSNLDAPIMDESTNESSGFYPYVKYILSVFYDWFSWYLNCLNIYQYFQRDENIQLTQRILIPRPFGSLKGRKRKIVNSASEKSMSIVKTGSFILCKMEIKPKHQLKLTLILIVPKCRFNQTSPRPFEIMANLHFSVAEIVVRQRENLISIIYALFCNCRVFF